MKSDNPLKRKWAAVALGMVDDLSVCNDLVQGFKDEYWPVRQNCADSLASYGVRALEVLIQNIQNEDPDIVYWTTRVMQKIKDKIWEKLKFYLSMGSDETRFFTAFAFGEIGDKAAADVLIKALDDGNDWVRKLAMDSLLKLGCIEELKARMATALPALKMDIMKKLRDQGAIPIDEFVKDLVSPSAGARQAALAAILEMGKSVIDQLKQAMENAEDEKLRLSLIKVVRALETGSEFGLDL